MSFRQSLINEAKERYKDIEIVPEYVEFINKIKKRCKNTIMVRRFTVSFSRYPNEFTYDLKFSGNQHLMYYIHTILGLNLKVKYTEQLNPYWIISW